MEQKLALAEEEYKSGNYRKAFELYSEIQETEQFILHLMQQKANCLLMLEEYEQSMIINLEMIRLYPTNAIGYANYALNLYCQGRGIEAIAFLNAAKSKVEFHADHVEIIKDAITQIESKLIFGEVSEEPDYEMGLLSRWHITNLKNIINLNSFPIDDFQFETSPSQTDEITRLNITYKDDKECRFTFTTKDSTLYYYPTPEGLIGPPVYSQFSYINFDILKEHFNKWLYSIFF